VKGGVRRDKSSQCIKGRTKGLERDQSASVVFQNVMYQEIDIRCLDISLIKDQA